MSSELDYDEICGCVPFIQSPNPQKTSPKSKPNQPPLFIYEEMMDDLRNR